MLNTYHEQARRKLVATVISIIIIAGVVLYADHLKGSKPTAVSTLTPTAVASTRPSGSSSAGGSGSSTDSSNSASSSVSAPSNSSSGSYKDGTYSATSNYYVPHGEEAIKVSLTLKGGVITDASVQNSEGDRESARFQEDFANEYKNYVVGKSVSGLRLSVISGASDTTGGFNDALQQIASQAKA